MRNNRIAVFTNGWSNEFLEKTIEGIRNEAKKDGIDIFIFTTYIYAGDSEQHCNSQLDIFTLPDPSRFDGAIMLANTFNIPGEQALIVERFLQAGVPMVSTEVRVPGMAYIGSSNYEGMYDLAMHLIDTHNVRKVVYVGGFESNEESMIREHALKDALAEHGLDLYDKIVSDFGFYNTSEYIREWIAAGHELPDAFVCANDKMAQGTTSVLVRLGIKVPNEVIVTGFDHERSARASFPMAATVSRNWDEIGSLAYHELIHQIECPNPDYEKVYPSKFVPSESCGCQPSAEDLSFRDNIIRNYVYAQNVQKVFDIFLKTLQVAMARVDTKENFFALAGSVLDNNDYLGPNYAICTEQSLFKADLGGETQVGSPGYSPILDVIYEKHDGKSISSTYCFRSEEMVPRYWHDEGTSNTYIFLPIYTEQKSIGYMVIKNDPSMLYNEQLQQWSMSINAMFETIRQYITAQDMNRKLRDIYMTDFLTGLYNRTGCENVLFAKIEKSKELGEPLVLLFADINRMKHINDAYGHLNGDLAIKATADALRASLGEQWLAGRYGGDEFVAVGNWENETNIRARCESVRDELNKYIEELNLSFELTVSLGFSIIHSDDHCDIASYVRMADEAMYRNKRN